MAIIQSLFHDIHNDCLIQYKNNKPYLFPSHNLIESKADRRYENHFVRRENCNLHHNTINPLIITLIIYQRFSLLIHHLVPGRAKFPPRIILHISYRISTQRARRQIRPPDYWKVSQH